MVELANVLNVDLSYIEARCQELVRSQETGCTIVLGQLIHSTYLKSLAIQINETLQMNGTLNISNLTTQFDLPGDYLQHVCGTFGRVWIINCFYYFCLSL